MNSTSIKDAFNRIKHAASATSLEQTSFAWLKNGRLWASDSRLSASTPLDIDLPNVGFSAITFGKYLARIQDDDPTANAEENKIVFKAKRGTQTLLTIPGETWDILEPEGEWKKVSSGFVDAVRRLRPFISTDYARLQFCCVAVWDGMAHATNNVTVARMAVDVPDGSYPFWLIEFICKSFDESNELLEIAEGDSCFSFCWADGTKVRAQKLATPMPELVAGIFDKYNTSAEAVSDEFKSAYDFVSSMADGNIYIEPHRIWTPHDERGQTETFIDTKMEGTAIFATRYFDNVMAEADYMDIVSMPGFTSFRGRAVTGGELEGLALSMKEVSR